MPRPFFPVFWVPAPVSGYGAGPAGMTGGEGSRVAWLVGMPRSMALLASFLHHLTFRKERRGGS